ncbi:MAG: hypothetical protein H8D67_30320 [Deltaproteobacteria bacterium]|nr:hypothetical protein [Deltaproteobacteria bacterium]
MNKIAALLATSILILSLACAGNLFAAGEFFSFAKEEFFTMSFSGETVTTSELADYAMPNRGLHLSVRGYGATFVDVNLDMLGYIQLIERPQIAVKKQEQHQLVSADTITYRRHNQ